MDDLITTLKRVRALCRKRGAPVHMEQRMFGVAEEQFRLDGAEKALKVVGEWLDQAGFTETKVEG